MATSRHGDIMTAVIVCGMPDEKRVLTNALWPGTLILSGTDKLNLPKLIPTSCTRIISMGLCGGLAQGLSVADTAVAVTVVDQAGSMATTDEAWNKRAIVAASIHLITLHEVPYYSSGIMDEADSQIQRAAMFKKYGAHAIDDETRYVVAEAAARNIPFNVVRPLSDDWTETLPLSATGAIMNKDGSADIEYLLRSLGQNQGLDSVSLFRVATDYSKSLNALEAVAKALTDLIAQ
jgi:hypothetical protein